MPTVRTKCPTCATVIVDATAMTLRRRADADKAEAVFTCPECLVTVVQPLSDRMVPVLIGAGCGVDEWESSDPFAAARAVHPANGSITEDEIDEFVRDLNAEGWMDELVREW